MPGEPHGVSFHATIFICAHRAQGAERESISGLERENQLFYTQFEGRTN